MALEQLGAFAGVGVRLDATQLAVLLAQLNGANADPLTDASQVRASFGHELVGKEVAVSIDESQAGCCLVKAAHNSSVQVLAQVCRLAAGLPPRKLGPSTFCKTFGAFYMTPFRHLR